MKENKCEWKFSDGTICGKVAIGLSRGFNLCKRHYNDIRNDNKYRAKHDFDIPHKDQTIKRRYSKQALDSH